MKSLMVLGIFSLMVGTIYASTKNEKPAESKPADAKVDGKKADDKNAPVKRTYTEEEFKKAVNEEMAKQMKKAGSGHLVDFSKELLDKEEQLKLKESELKKKEEELKLSRNDFQKKVIEFEESQKKFLGCIEGQKEALDKRVSQMVEVISGMKPQSAADILAIQDPELSVRILAMLESQKASKIFNLMDKEISAKLQKQFMQMKK
jgi:flagellar motility protein MotE (MotC chaperone)